MKMKPIFLIALLAAGVQSVDAARKPAQVGAAVDAIGADIKPLLTAIESADLQKVDEQLGVSGEVMNKHNGEFSPLGKVQHALRENKMDTSLPKGEKTAKTRNLNKIEGRLRESGATLIYDNSGSGKKAIAAKRQKMKKDA